MAVILPCSHVYEALDLLLVLSPRVGSFCRGQAHPVWCGHVWCCRWALTSSTMDSENFDVTDNNRQKKLFPHLLLQRRCILVRVPHGVKDVRVSGVWTASRVKFSTSLSEHPLIHTDVPTCSDRPLNLSVMNSQHKTRVCTPIYLQPHQHFPPHSANLQHL